MTVRGLKGLNLPLVDAIAISNDATGASVSDTGRGAPDETMAAQGRVRMALHGARGEVNGALLEDGTIVRVPPPEAERFARLLAPGATVAVRGPGIQTPLGTVVDARALGASPDRLTEISAPPPKPPRGEGPGAPPSG